MEVLDQVKETVEKMVEEVKTNTTGLQEKTQERIEKVKDDYQTAITSLKDEFSHSSTTFKGYQERISTKLNKHFSGKELVSDIKEEVDFFSKELKDSVERIKDAFKK